MLSFFLPHFWSFVSWQTHSLWQMPKFLRMFSPPPSFCTILGYRGLREPGVWAHLVLVSKPHLQEGQWDDTGGKGKQKA